MAYLFVNPGLCLSITEETLGRNPWELAVGPRGGLTCVFPAALLIESRMLSPFPALLPVSEHPGHLQSQVGVGHDGLARQAWPAPTTAPSPYQGSVREIYWHFQAWGPFAEREAKGTPMLPLLIHWTHICHFN